MTNFRTSTTLQEAGRLTALTFQAIAAGWPNKYFHHDADGNLFSVDGPVIVQDAVEMAAQIDQAVFNRCYPEPTPIQTGPVGTVHPED